MTNPQQLALHGVFMSIHGIGTLITGESGIGKSEIALALMDRNHQLVADDMPIFTQTEKKIIGSANKEYKEFIHIRGIGFINAVKVFGPSVILNSCPLQLVIHLLKENLDENSPATDRHSEFEIFNIKIPKITIPLLSYLNLTIVIETVVKSFLLKISSGYDASSEFEKIQQQQIGNHHS